MAIPRILLVDDEPAVHQLVRTMLKRDEYTVDTVPNGLEAQKKVKQSTPDLIVTDVLMPFMDGWTLVKNFRSTPALALVPVIFLTSQSSNEDHIRGFRLGADDYIDKTTGFWELPERISRALARRKEIETTVRPAPGASPSSGLRGKFDQIGLASLLTVLDLGKRGGILRVRRPEPAEEGVLYLVDGRVHRSELQDRRQIKDREAVYTMLSWSTGTFEFSAEKLRVGDQVGLATTELLLEGARRLDERRSKA